MPERRTRLPNARRADRPSNGAGGTAVKDRDARLTPRGQKTRERLIIAGRKVFERDGFLQARITDICRTAHVSYGSFYTYFDTKEELFTEVAKSVELDLPAVMSAHEDADALELIDAVNRHYLEAYRKNSKLMAVIREVSGFDPELRRTRVQRQRQLALLIEDRIRTLQTDGTADGAIDPAYAAQALSGMVANFAEHLFSDKTPFDLETAVEQLTRICANALGITTVRHGRRTAGRSRGRS
jgi:AcrR family transcriptional regulator